MSIKNDEYDLVELIKTKIKVSPEVEEELEELQDMIKIFIAQKEIYDGNYEIQKRKPLWID